MIAAIYARKSTDQNVPDEEKRIARQTRARPRLRGHGVTEPSLPPSLSDDVRARFAEIATDVDRPAEAPASAHGQYKVLELPASTS